jgi:hypothetical protein
MATKNLERDKARFAEWRRQRQGREPIPEELWRIAAAHIGGMSVNRVSREFHLSFSRLQEKAQEFGIESSRGKRKRVRNGSEVAFQELPLNAMLAAPASVPCLLLERPDGMRVRIEGQLPDAEYVSKLAACLWK